MADEAVKKTDRKPAEKKPPKIDPHEMVKIRLHMDKQHMAPLHVVVNDYAEDIPRAVDVYVPYYVAKHIAEIEAQDNRTLLLTRSLSDRFEQKLREIGGM